MTAAVRFDDLTPGREAAFALVGMTGELIADGADEVQEVIEAARQASVSGKWVAGFVSYEAAPAFDPALTVRPPDGALGSRVPAAWFAVFADRRPAPPLPADRSYRTGSWRPSVDVAHHREALIAVHDRIAAGDTYQVNYSFRLRTEFDGDPLSFYADLARAQRGAHSAYLDTGGLVIAGASPELFFSINDRRVVTRPMKGTAARGRWPEEDAAKAAALLASSKERAENLMIVDLLRNDMGRIAEFGSVTVDDLFRAERYETVWQMTSTISARPRPDAGLVEVFEALFPCGSVTGAPKPSTMAIIADLETSRRGVYCGAVGYLEPGGRDALFNVAIRTATIDPSAGEAEYGTGGGITWDSAAAAEHAEALAKARVLTTRRSGFRLLETLRWDGGAYWALERHIDRLAASAEYFRFRIERGEVETALGEAAAAAGPTPSRVRLTLAEDGAIEVGSDPILTDEEPVVLAIDEEPVDSTDPMLFHKTDARDRYDRRAARHADADDVVLVNQRGEVTETTIANLMVRFGDRWYTPPLDSGCLPGVYRAWMLEAGEAAERVLTPADLREADELAVVNSVRLWRKARLAD